MYYFLCTSVNLTFFTCTQQLFIVVYWVNGWMDACSGFSDFHDIYRLEKLDSAAYFIPDPIISDFWHCLFSDCHSVSQVIGWCYSSLVITDYKPNALCIVIIHCVQIKKYSGYNQ